MSNGMEVLGLIKLVKASQKSTWIEDTCYQQTTQAKVNNMEIFNHTSVPTSPLLCGELDIYGVCCHQNGLYSRATAKKANNNKNSQHISDELELSLTFA